MLSQRLYSLQVILTSDCHMWHLVYVYSLTHLNLITFRKRCVEVLVINNKETLPVAKYCVFRPSYRSGTVTWSYSGPPCRAVTEVTCSWSRRNSALWPCREKSRPASTSCSPSTVRNSNAWRGRRRGTGSKWRPLRPSSGKGRRSADGWR